MAKNNANNGSNANNGNNTNNTQDKIGFLDMEFWQLGQNRYLVTQANILDLSGDNGKDNDNKNMVNLEDMIWQTASLDDFIRVKALQDYYEQNQAKFFARETWVNREVNSSKSVLRSINFRKKLKNVSKMVGSKVTYRGKQLQRKNSEGNWVDWELDETALRASLIRLFTNKNNTSEKREELTKALFEQIPGKKEVDNKSQLEKFKQYFINNKTTIKSNSVQKAAYAIPISDCYDTREKFKNALQTRLDKYSKVYGFNVASAEVPVLVELGIKKDIYDLKQYLIDINKLDLSENSEKSVENLLLQRLENLKNETQDSKLQELISDEYQETHVPVLDNLDTLYILVDLQLSQQKKLDQRESWFKAWYTIRNKKTKNLSQQGSLNYISLKEELNIKPFLKKLSDLNLNLLTVLDPNTNKQIKKYASTIVNATTSNTTAKNVPTPPTTSNLSNNTSNIRVSLKVNCNKRQKLTKNTKTNKKN